MRGVDLGGTGRDAEPQHLVDRELDARGSTCIDHGVAARDRDRHWFLGIDVFAGCRGRQGLGQVRSVGRGQDYGIDIGAAEEPLDRRLGVHREFGGDRRCSATSGDGDQSAIGHLADRKSGRIGASHVARSDDPKSDRHGMTSSDATCSADSRQ